MLSAAGHIDWAATWTAIGVIWVIALAVIGAAVRLIVRVSRLIETVTENTKAIDKNARHLDGMMATLWPLIWRTTTIEEWLERITATPEWQEWLGDRYHAPSLIPNPRDSWDEPEK